MGRESKSNMDAPDHRCSSPEGVLLRSVGSLSGPDYDDRGVSPAKLGHDIPRFVQTSMQTTKVLSQHGDRCCRQRARRDRTWIEESSGMGDLGTAQRLWEGGVRLLIIFFQSYTKYSARIILLTDFKTLDRVNPSRLVCLIF